MTEMPGTAGPLYFTMIMERIPVQHTCRMSKTSLHALSDIIMIIPVIQLCTGKV